MRQASSRSIFTSFLLALALAGCAGTVEPESLDSDAPREHVGESQAAIVGACFLTEYRCRADGTDGYTDLNACQSACATRCVSYQSTYICNKPPGKDVL